MISFIQLLSPRSFSFFLLSTVLSSLSSSEVLSKSECNTEKALLNFLPHNNSGGVFPVSQFCMVQCAFEIGFCLLSLLKTDLVTAFSLCMVLSAGWYGAPVMCLIWFLSMNSWNSLLVNATPLSDTRMSCKRWSCEDSSLNIDYSPAHHRLNNFHNGPLAISIHDYKKCFPLEGAHEMNMDVWSSFCFR